MTEINQMIIELYNKLVLKTNKTERKARKITLRQFFINSYVKEDKFREFTPFELSHGILDDILNPAAQITFKCLTPDKKAEVTKEYESLTVNE